MLIKTNGYAVSGELIIPWSGVQIPEGPPSKTKGCIDAALFYCQCDAILMQP